MKVDSLKPQSLRYVALAFFNNFWEMLLFQYGEGNARMLEHHQQSIKTINAIFKYASSLHEIQISSTNLRNSGFVTGSQFFWKSVKPGQIY